MATSRLEKVDEFLTCTICTDEYTDPCTLWCQHTFCRKCVTQYTKTRPEALQSKTIPCPSCRQVTTVPNPARPVDEWAWQIKPSIIILGLTERSQPGQTSAETGQCCCIREGVGETTPATLRCQQCEKALSSRCTPTRYGDSSSCDHNLFDLCSNVNVKSQYMCKEHKDEYIKFHCRDCKKSACPTCCVIYHRACKSVVTIESLKPEIKTLLAENRRMVEQRHKTKAAKLDMERSSMDKASENKLRLKSEIQCVSEKAIDKIKQKEKQLMEKLDEVTEKQIGQLQSDVKTEEIDIQTYRQHCEFIDQTVDSDCLMDMYNGYQLCESGALVFRDARENHTSNTQQISNVRFTTDLSNIQHVLDNLQLGDIDVDYLDVSNPFSYPVLINTTDVTTEDDQTAPALRDVTVLYVDGVQTAVVTDHKNNCVKSFYTVNNQACHSQLSIDDSPWGITKLEEDKVMVAVPLSMKILTINVTPSLTLLTNIKTSKYYFNLSVLKPSSTLAASACDPSSVDILNMEGEILKSVSHHNNIHLFETPWYLCVSNKGNILVSDGEMKSVTCLTSDGDFVWKYSPSRDRKLYGARGITTTSTGRILVGDRFKDKVIELNETGEYVRDVLTLQNGILKARGLTVDRNDSLILCSQKVLQEFTFA